MNPVEGQANAINEGGNAGAFVLFLCVLIMFAFDAWARIAAMSRRIWWLITTPRICSWCHKTKRHALIPLNSPTHGICKACGAKWFAEPSAQPAITRPFRSN